MRAKFDALTESFAGPALRDEIATCVAELETCSAAELMGLLSRVRA